MKVEGNALLIFATILLLTVALDLWVLTANIHASPFYEESQSNGDVLLTFNFSPSKVKVIDLKGNRFRAGGMGIACDGVEEVDFPVFYRFIKSSNHSTVYAVVEHSDFYFIAKVGENEKNITEYAKGVLLKFDCIATEPLSYRESLRYVPKRVVASDGLVKVSLRKDDMSAVLILVGGLSTAFLFLLIESERDFEE